MLLDAYKLPEKKRMAVADKIRTVKDFNLPDLEYFNSSPCANHEILNPACQQCGVVFRKHQRVGIAWMFTAGNGLLADSVGTGKDQPLHSRVLTPHGWVTMGSLRVGDLVVDPEGSHSEVTGVFPQGSNDVYRIAFSDGSWAESSLTHLWRVRTPKPGKWVTLELGQILSKMKKGGNHNRFAVPLPVKCSDFPGNVKDYSVKWIRSIEFVRNEPTQCISVSAPSHLYITDNWTVTHNTIQAAGATAMLKQAGRVAEGQKILVVCRPSAVPQWQMQMNRLVKNTPIIVAEGAKNKRIENYQALDWEICIMGYQMLINDLERLDSAFSFAALFVDDVDPLRNGDTSTSYAINRISRDTEHKFILTGTPLQKRLHDLYHVLQPLNVRDVLGSPISFERRYVRKDTVTEVSSTGNVSTIKKVTGYRNLEEFKDKISHLTLRRTASDIDDVDLPAIIPSNVFLEPYQAQKDKYRDLQEGVLRIIKDQGEEVKRATAIAKFLYGAQICGGLAMLGEPDRMNTSVKLDWVEEKIVDGDLSDEKVVTFINFKNGVRALQARLDRAGVGYATIWGESKNNKDRFDSQQRFWNDDSCRVLIGTTSIEQSLNLQVARHLINVDMIMNPSRMEQLAGRIRRDGSQYSSVYVHNLLTVGTQEERYLPALEREQALIDHIWQSKSELFEALSPLALLQMIGGNK